MGKEEELKKVIKLITQWIAEIKANNFVNFYDINKVAEDLSRSLLNEIYGYQLENLNYEKNNYPGIDLGDKENNIGFQVTSRRDTRKIQDSLEKFKKIGYENYSNGIRFLILNQEKKPKLNKDKYRKIYSAFDPEEHIFTANDLIQEITQLYETDRNTFYRIKDILKDELEIDTIGIQAKNNINNMAGIEGELNSFIFTLLNKFQNKDLKIVQDYEYPNLITVPPILPEKISKRKKLINDLLIILENCTWLAIQGEKGIGKTILTLLLIEKFKGSHIWISFRDVKKELSCHHLDSAFIAYFGEKISRQKLDSLLCSLFSKLTKHSIVIFDDLPDLSENFNFAQKLIFIEKAAKRNDLKIISSSSLNLSENFRFSVAQNELKIFEIPAFSSDEIGEILNAYQAPFNLVKSQFINFISVITGDHPILINALIRHILANSWCTNIEMFEDLLKREFARNEKKEFLTIFSKTVSDDLKELIYRLDLVKGGFTDHEIKLVSNIKPRIEKPFEKLNPAFQIWVRGSGNRYSLSPILEGLGKKNLFSDISKEIYLTLAEDIINRRHLNHIEVTHVILYFVSAQDYNNAAIMLMNALIALLEVKAEKIDDYGIATMWANKPLPEEIELDLRLAIRVLQLKTHEKLNKDVSFILNDLDRLVSDAGEKEILGLVAVTFHFVTSNTIKELSTFYKYFLKLSKIPGIDSFFPPKISLEKAMWLCTIHIKTGEDLLEWLNAVEMMSVKSRNALFKANINMLQSSVVMCENIFLWESKKLQENQNWAEVLKILEEVETRAKNLELEILWSSAIRTQIIVLAEYMDQFEKAIQLGERSLKIATENPIVQYLLKGIIAKQYLISGDYRTADQWYILAAKQEIESLHILRLFSLLDHCLTVSHLDLKRALKICEKAVIFAEQNAKTISKDLLVMALGEYTILIFQNFGVNDAFESLGKRRDR